MSNKWKPGDGDTVCQECGAKNPCWYADCDVWRRIVPKVSGVLCPNCFMAKEDRIWKVVPDLIDDKRMTDSQRNILDQYEARLLSYRDRVTHWDRAEAEHKLATVQEIRQLLREPPLNQEKP